jgi:NTE family protein
MTSVFRWGRKRTPDGPVLGGVALGPQPWLVLGGGGLKGLAHLGALRALAEVDFTPVGVVGTSIGALVGACYSSDRSIDEMERLARSVDRNDIAQLPRRFLWAKAMKAPSLYRGDVLREYFTKVLPPGGWESLSVRFQLNAVELGTGRMEWFGIGARTDVNLVDAVYASAALPVFYPPCPLPGGLYVDGGTEDALPIRRAAELGATGIVAIDVGAAETAEAERVLRHGMLAVHERVFGIMSGRRRRETVAEWEGPPLLYIRPKLDAFGALDFHNLDRTMEEGRRATEAALGLVSEPAP